MKQYIYIMVFENNQWSRLQKRIMNKVGMSLKRIMVSAISFFSILLLLYLAVTSMNATVYLSEYEKCFYCKDYPLVHICVIMLIIAVFIFLKRISTENRKESRSMLPVSIIVLIIYGIILFTLYRHLRIFPIFDQNHVFQIAGRLINYDYIDFLKGGYGEKWTNQWGYLLLLMTEFKLFGVRNADAVYIINILFILGIAWGMYGFGKRFLKDQSVITLVAICLFVPLWSFSTFIYGNIPSCFFGIIALNLLYDFFEQDSMTKGILSTVLISAAVMLKTTQLIFFIAFLIYLLMQTFPEKGERSGIIKRITLLLLCLLLYCFSGRCIHLYMEKSTGMDLGEGVPRVAHIAMAMHENSDASGWYDGYIDTVYEENGFDIELTKQAAMADLKSSLQQFKSNPAGAIGFYSRKILSQWIEPTCESIFILLNRHAYSENGQYNPNGLPVNRLGSTLMQFMNFMQTVIYFGAFLFFSIGGIRLIRNKQHERSLPDYKNAVDDLFTGLVTLGAFAFYILWEANSQYALFFILLLIPCAVSGYGNMADEIISIYRDHSNKKAALCPPAAVLVLVIITALLPKESSIRRLLVPDWSTEQYKTYLSEMLEAGVKEYNPIDTDHTLYVTRYDDAGKARFRAGRYYIMPVSEPECYLVPSDKSIGASVIIGGDADNRMILTSRSEGYAFRFQSTQFVMDVENASKSPGARLQQYEQNGDPSQVFSFTPTDDGAFLINYIYGDGLVLTAHEDGSVTVEVKEDKNPMQQWKIISE